MSMDAGVFYAHLIDKPVVGTDEQGHAVRGILRADGKDQSPLVRSFNGLSGCWQFWETLTELDFGELTKDELRAWHYGDPLGYLAAGFAWAARQDAGGAL